MLNIIYGNVITCYKLILTLLIL